MAPVIVMIYNKEYILVFVLILGIDFWNFLSDKRVIKVRGVTLVIHRISPFQPHLSLY